MRIAVTGAGGQIATALAERAPSAGVELLRLARPEFDLLDRASIEGAIAHANVEVVVSAAAFTAVDAAESQPELAFAVNRDGAAAVARAARSAGASLIHLSTDYVFDGSKAGAYVETDRCRPLGVYGNSKLEGEEAVMAAAGDHVILRTAWVYSPFGRNFVKTMLQLASQRDEIKVVSDQVGSPTSVLDIADAILVIARNLRHRPNDAGLRGIFHYGGGGAVSWAGFAEEIFRLSAAQGGPSATVVPIATADYPTAARRPANSRLDSSRIVNRHGVGVHPWKEGLAPVVGRLVATR
jgi:dTDP-4-dehydrorhamnose reductase